MKMIPVETVKVGDVLPGGHPVTAVRATAKQIHITSLMSNGEPITEPRRKGGCMVIES